MSPSTFPCFISFHFTDTKKKIRYLCLKAKTANKLEVVKKLREITPAGTTGELKYTFTGVSGMSGYTY